MTSKKNQSALTTLVTVFFFWGFIAASNGVFIPFCKTYFNIDQFQSQLVDFAFYGAYYLGALFLFVMSSSIKKDVLNNWGYKKGIIYGLLISALGALLMYPFIDGAQQGDTSIFYLVLVALFIVGLGFSLQQTAANPFVYSLGDPNKGSQRLNLAGGVNSFVFDGTDDYITSTLTGLSSTQYTMAGWIKVNTLDSTVNTFFGLGDWASGDGRAIGIAITGDNVIGANVKGLADAKFSEVTTGEWYHVVADFTSGNDTHLYVNGKLVDTVAGTTFAIPTNPPLFIGSRANASGTVETARLFPGSIANFRLFNRVLTSDEIWQLYAYQKEYFGHGDLSMTLKAGRLGIGTSEPRAALDVRGRITREYNPGEIIETIQGKANGRYVKVQSGTYLLPNVGDIQDLTSTHTRINGSNFDYTPPPGTTRVIYEFWFFLRRIDDSPILHVAGRVDGSQVNDARHTFRHQTDNIGTDPQIWIYNHMCISIGEVTSDNIAGGQVATWNSPRTIDFSARIFSGSFDARLHKTNHWDGSGDDILVRPTIKITAIA